MQPIVVKRATLESIPDIQAVARQVWPVTYGNVISGDQLNYMLDKFYSTESLTRQMSEQGQEFILATEFDMVLGFASYSHLGDGIFKLHKLYVFSYQQGKNVGRRLLRYVVEDIRTRNAKRLILNVNRYNRAKLFYERLGFEVLEEVDIPIGNGYYMNDFVMGKEL